MCLEIEKRCSFNCDLIIIEMPLVGRLKRCWTTLKWIYFMQKSEPEFMLCNRLCQSSHEFMLCNRLCQSSHEFMLCNRLCQSSHDLQAWPKSLFPANQHTPDLKSLIILQIRPHLHLFDSISFHLITAIPYSLAVLSSSFTNFKKFWTTLQGSSVELLSLITYLPSFTLFDGFPLHTHTKMNTNCFSLPLSL